jgi:hypothetical protein
LTVVTRATGKPDAAGQIVTDCIPHTQRLPWHSLAYELQSLLLTARSFYLELARLFRPSGDLTMSLCETCGNEYDKAFTVTIGGEKHTFDSFECAIQALAPDCAHCGCKVIGHGVEQDDMIYCSASCAEHHGTTHVKDRA